MGAGSEAWKGVIDLGELRGAQPADATAEPPPAASGSLARPEPEPAGTSDASASPPSPEPVTPSGDEVSVEVRDDQDERDLIREILRDRDVFVEVGARTGAMSLVASRRVGDHGRAVAIEPNAGAVAYLQRTVAREGRRNLTIVQAAVGVDPAAGSRPLEAIVRRLGLSRVDLLRVEVGAALPGVLEGIRSFIDSPTLIGPVLITIDQRALERHGISLDPIDQTFPAEIWADTTGLRLGGVDPDAPIVSRVFERR